MSRWFAAFVAGLCWLPASTGQAQAPKLNYVVPLGVPAGQPVELTLFGENLSEPASLWTSLTPPPAVLQPPASSLKPAASLKSSLTLPAIAPLGVFALRLVTGQGVSNVRLLWVDDLPTILDDTESLSPAKARDVPIPAAVEGAVLAESRRYYKFHAAGGQRLSFEVVARRLGSPLDAYLRLLDSGGRELASSDDDDAVGADSRFVYRFTTAGDYLLELGDVRYQGNATYRYRLRIGDFPLATAPFPLGVQQGFSTALEVTGDALGELARLETSVPAGLKPERLTLRAEYPGGHGGSPVTVLATTNLEQVEFEPNDTLPTASPLDPLGAASARFAADGDRDYFRFAAKKDQRLVIRGRTRSLGLRRDLFLRLLDAQGQQLAPANPTSDDDVAIDFTFPADGNYFLLAEDLLGRGGPDHVYRIEFAPYRPGFTLATDADTYNVPCGGVFPIKVTAVRNGYAGPIELALSGLDAKEAAAFTLAGATIPAGKSAGQVTLTAPASLSPGSWRPFRLVGRAQINQQPYEAPASGAAALRTALNGCHPLPPELEGVLALGVGPVFPKFLDLKAADKFVAVKQLSGGADFKIEVVRLEKFAGPVTLTAAGLPSGWELKPATVAGKSEASLTLTGPRAAAEGEHAFRIIAMGTHLNQPGRAALDMTLRIVRRDTAAAAGETPAAQGAAP